MEYSAAQIAQLLGGQVEGSAEVKVNNLSKIEEGTKGTLSFLANPQYTPYIYNTEASIVIVNNDFEAEKPIAATLIRVPSAYEAFAQLLDIYNQLQQEESGIDEHAFIDPSAKIGDGAYIGGFCYIGRNVKIGKNARIYPHTYIGNGTTIGDDCTFYSGVKVYNDCTLGDKITLHSGVIVGGDGFGFAPNQGEYKKVAQIGNVILEDMVEVGANTTIDRATLGHTIIRKGVKLDNLIQIAHNVEIGENTVIAAQTGVAGSTKIGKNCMIGGQVGIVGHLKIGDNVKIAAQSGIGQNIEDNQIVQGSPAFGIGDYKRSYVYFRKLGSMAKDIEELKKLVQKKDNA